MKLFIFIHGLCVLYIQLIQLNKPKYLLIYIIMCVLPSFAERK